VPYISVIVDDTCSGLRSLISLIALSTVWTALMPRATWWQKAIVVVGSIPIALAANMVRILVLVLLSAIYGTQIAESVLHYGSGVVMFGVAVVVLMWLSRMVQRWSWPALGLNRSPSSL
jgi:exosortase/archaeosortase family protein